MSIFRLELRRSSALGAAFLVLLVGIAALYVNPGQWSRGWLSLALTTREYTLLLWPLSLAAGAALSLRDRRSRVTELFATTPRSRVRRMWPLLLAVAVTFALAYVLIVVAGGGSLVLPSHYFPAATLVITAAGALSLVSAAWLGLGLGRLLPVPATVPIVAVLGVLFVFFDGLARPLWPGSVLSPIYASTKSYDHPYQTIDPRVSLAFSIWMAALAVTGLTLFVARRRWLRVAAVSPALIGLGLAVAMVPRDPGALDSPIDPAASAMVCTVDAPKVCVSRVNAAVLDDLTPLARAGLAALNRLPGTPTEVRELVRPIGAGEKAGPPETGFAPVRLTLDRHGRLTHPGSVVPLIVGSLGVTTQGYCDGRHHAVERAAAYYLLGRVPVSDVGVDPDTTGEDPEINRTAIALWKTLRTLPEEEALARVAAVRQAVIDCRDSSTLLSRRSR